MGFPDDRILVFAAVFGVIILVSGVHLANDTLTLLRISHVTTGRVVDYQQEGRAFFPIVEFIDESGSTVTAQSSDGMYAQAYGYGAKIPILYNPKILLEGVRINNFLIWLGPTLLVVGGAFNLALPIGLYWRNRSKNTPYTGNER
jgi:hypothetical protein